MEYKFALSGNKKIFYHERGSGFPLVLLMGFGADGSVWEKHAVVYEKYFRCIILDNRGVGLSDQPDGPYTTEMMAEDTVVVMDHAGVRQAHVAGISMGGAIAQMVAIRYPDRVKKLLLVSTWGRFNTYASKVYENLKHIRPVVPASYFMELLQLWIFAPAYYENHIKELEEAAIGTGNAKNAQSTAGFNGQLDACISHNSIPELNIIRSQTLITVGLKDIFTPPEFSYQLKEGIKDADLSEYPEGGHVHHWEDLKRFNGETLEFLKN